MLFIFLWFWGVELCNAKLFSQQPDRLSLHIRPHEADTKRELLSPSDSSASDGLFHLCV